MPRKSSTYWSAMDFGSEEDETTLSKTPSARIYVDPWDLENYAFMRRHLEESTPDPSTPQSPAGEPASSTFYYVQNNQDYLQSVLQNGSLQRTLPSADSPTLFAGIDELDFQNDNFEMPYDHHNHGVYYYHPYDDYVQDRKLIVPRPTLTDTGSSLSSGNENYVYTTDGCDPTSPDASLVYVYETTTRKRKIALPKSSRRPSTQSQPKPAMRKFRRIPNIDCMECGITDNPGYIDNYMDMHMVPSMQIKPPPENFGLSSYGHLKIDYSCSWHSLDKLIQNEER